MFWARIFTTYYFAFFLIVMPVVGLIETPRQLPGLDQRGGARQGAASRRAHPPPRKWAKGVSPNERTAAHLPIAAVLLTASCRSPIATVKPRMRARSTQVERVNWTFAGLRGQYDRAQLQRGFQVYQNVCSACHGLKRVRFRNLAEPGGPELPEAAVKALAIGWPNKISGELDDAGNPIDRLPGLADPILGPYKNDKQARAAQNGALPPDLSLIVRARGLESTAPWYTHWFWMLVDIGRGYQEGGADYVYDLLTGFRDAPAGVQMGDGMYLQPRLPRPSTRDAAAACEGQLRRIPGGRRRQRLARPERARRVGFLPGRRTRTSMRANASAGGCCSIS